jgi:hypothetical protein
MGPRNAATCARKYAYEADPEGYVQRGRIERKHRRVTLRPAPDTMSLPFCDAPVRHIDHIQSYSDGGPTIYPNGRGACERGNYARETRGWKVEAVCSGLDGQTQTIKIITRTGHIYLSRAP